MMADSLQSLSDAGGPGDQGQEVPKGYWLVKAQWYKLVQTSQRAYVLLPEIIQLNVNAMVRLPDPITFEPRRWLR